MQAKVLAFDLGGTKLMAGVVNASGEILERRVESTELQLGPQGLIEQLVRIGLELREPHPDIEAACVASAGPLDPYSGQLLDPTNLLTKGEHWGVVDVTEPLCHALERPCFLENDAAAAVLAEAAWGKAQGQQNLAVITLGTGVGVGVLVNGELLRAGRGLHPEFSHTPIQHGQSDAQCGCGVLGCAEAFLAASHFIQRQRYSMGMPQLTGHDLLSMAAAGESRARTAFQQYADWMAIFMNSLVVSFAPELVLFGGGFNGAYPHFAERMQTQLEKLLVTRRRGVDMFPRFGVCGFQEDASLMGAAKVAFDRRRA